MESQFRLNAKNLALTYPQAPPDWTKESVLSFFQTSLRDNLSEYVVAQEEHKDGNPHFHVYLGLHSRVDIRNARELDINGHHGNYKTAKPKSGWIKYCTKFPNYISNIDIKKSKETKNKEILEMCLEKGPTSLLEAGLVSLKEYVWVNNGYNLYKSQKVEDPREDLPSKLPNPWVNDFNIDFELKRCHLWIWSTQPNLGKTTWLLNLKRQFRLEFWNVFEVFQNQIKKETQIIAIDEFRGMMKISMLNALCDGTLLIPQKGLPPLELAEKPLVIIVGNKGPEEVYKSDLQQYIEARFNIIKLD